MKQQIIINILIGLCCASLGFGASQMTGVAALVSQVKENSVNVANLVKSSQEQRDDFKAEKTRTDERIFKLADLVTGSMSQNKEFISLIREQNALFKQMLEQRR